MQAQLSLFGSLGDSLEPAENKAVGIKINPVILRDLTIGFVSPAQKHIAAENPYFFQFKNRTLEEIEELDNLYGKKFYQTAKHRDWLNAYWTAQTIALEKLYAARDVKFLDRYSAKFWLVANDGKAQEVCFDHSPCLFFATPTRVTVPNPHIEFRTEEPSPISETGYRSHFLNCIPFNEVSSMEELITLIVKKHLSINAEIIF